MPGGSVRAVAADAPGSLFTRAFVALAMADLAYFTAGGALIGVTPFFVTGPLGSSDAAVGVAVGAFSVSTLVMRPLAGRWTDRRGRRPLLVGGAALFAVLCAAHLLVTALPWLVALRLALGVAEALFFVASFAALADLAPPGRAGEALSYNSLSLYVGLAAGPLLGHWLLSSGGFDAVWTGIAVLVLVAAAVATRVPETVVQAETPTPGAPLVHRAALVPGFALLCGVGATSGFLAFAGLRAVRLGLEEWSSVLLLFGGVVVACRLAFARLPDRVPPLRLAAAALATSTAGLVLLAAVPTVHALLVGAALLGIGTAFLTPAVFAAVFRSVPASQRGSAAGTTSVFVDLGLGGGPLLLGLVAGRSGIPAGFAAGAAVTLTAAAVLGWRARGRRVGERRRRGGSSQLRRPATG